MSLKPVKTLFLEAVELRLSTITDIHDFTFGPKEITDVETALFPFGFIFDNPRPTTNRNRVDEVHFTLHMEVWFKDEVNRLYAADMLYALITKALWYDPAWYKKYAPEIKETLYEKWYFEEPYGAIVLEYDITLRHAANDPFTLNPS